MQPVPPSVESLEHVISAPFGIVKDEYFWLRDDSRTATRVLQHLEEENAYTTKILQSTEELQDQLADEMENRIPVVEETAGYVRKGQRYFKRRQQGDEYWRWYRCKYSGADDHCSATAPGTGQLGEELLLDENAESKGWQYFDVGSMAVSPDGQLVAFTVDTQGDEFFKLFVRQASSSQGQQVEPLATNCASNVEWDLDSQTLFYLQRPTREHVWQLVRRTVGGDAVSRGCDGGSPTSHPPMPTKLMRKDSKGTLGVYEAKSVTCTESYEAVLFECGDEESTVSIRKTASMRYLLLEIRGGSTFALDLSVPPPAGSSSPRRLQSVWREVAPESDERDFLMVENWGHSWLFLVDDDEHPDGQLVAAHTPHLLDHQVLFEVGEGQELEAFQVTRRHLAVLTREKDCAVIRAFAMPEDSRKKLPKRPLDLVWEKRLESAAVAVSLDDPPDGWEATVLRYSTSSLVAPDRVVEVDLHTLREATAHVERVEGGFVDSDYCTTSLLATSHDGVEVPLTVAHHRLRFKRNGTHPLVLLGYGAYGNKQRPSFNPAELCLLDRGWAVAIAHVRGGGERGAAWHRDGKLLDKPNTFHDFLAVAEHLVQERYTSRGLIAAWGRSAGGMLVGATLNMEPGLFGAAVLDVPFVDVLATMLDPTLPMTIRERGEWGDPLEDEEEYRCIASYSPYDNIQAQPYPHMLITAGLHDTRVPYWGPAKYAARVRARRTDGGMTLLKVDTSSGHFAASGASDRLMARALKYAFLMKALERT